MCSKVAWWASCRWCPLRLTGLVSVATELVKPYALCGQTALGTVTAFRPGGTQQTSDFNSITDILLSPGYYLPADTSLRPSLCLTQTTQVNSGLWWLLAGCMATPPAPLSLLSHFLRAAAASTHTVTTGKPVSVGRAGGTQQTQMRGR